MANICYIGPLSIHSARWIRAFTQRNYSTTLITDSKAWRAPTLKHTRVFTIPMLSKQNVVRRFTPNLLAVMRFLKKIKPDIVNLHVQHHYSPAIIFSHYPYVLTSWGLEVLKLPHADFLTKNLAKMTATFARKIIVDAECLKEIWIAMGISKSKTEVIPFGVDLNVFHPDKNSAFIRKELQIKQSDIVVISTRHFRNDHYNVECLIKAVPLVVKRHKNVRFILKGIGPLETHFKRLVSELKVSEYVRFVGLTLHNEVANYLAASDIYTSTSFIDSTSVSLLEAMACGLAPIVTDIPGNREWITNGVNGLLFPPKNSKALAEKIIRLIENEDIRKRFGVLCTRIVKQKASWENCVDKMEAIYQSLL